jgi:DNA-binding response OmpR family regulator
MPWLDDKNALIVDDDKAVNDLVRDMLRANGFNVVTCFNGEQALEAAKKSYFRIIITDYRMPGMRGPDVVRILRGLFPKAFIIGLSADQKERDFLDAGADVFLIKPDHIVKIHSLTAQCEPKK